MGKQTVYLNSYGNEAKEERGLVSLILDTDDKTIQKQGYMPLDGKANATFLSENCIYTAVQCPQENSIRAYDLHTEQLLWSLPTRYFYNYIQVYKAKLFLASYESGVDSVYDLTEKSWVGHCVHQREAYEAKKHSHYIHAFTDGRVVSVENSLQQLYLYADDSLKEYETVDFPPINIRLLSFHPRFAVAYLNTELSNELLVLETKQFTVLERHKLTDYPHATGAGNAISEDGRFVCVSVRAENMLYLFAVEENGYCKLVQQLPCKAMPRDVKFVQDCLLVSCTKDNVVELYQLVQGQLKKRDEVMVYQPITFSME